MKKIPENNVDYLQSSDDSFDNFLSSQLKQSHKYLPDDNFSASVIAQLPKPRANSKLSRFHECLIIAIPLIIISALVLSQFAVVAFVIKAWTWLFVVDVSNFLVTAVALMLAALAASGFWFAKQCRIF